MDSAAEIINDFKNPVMESENLSKEASLHEEDMRHAKDAVDNLASKLNISGSEIHERRVRNLLLYPPFRGSWKALQ